MELKSSYKQTEVDLLPEEWRVEAIGKLIDDRVILGHLDGNHGELYPRSPEFKSHGVPYIGANDFEDGNVNLDRCKFLSQARAKQFRKGVAVDGDVLFAHNATVGPVALLRTSEPFVILSTTATYFRCDPAKLSNLYLKAALQSHHFMRQYHAVMAQSTRFQVPITAQRKLSLVIPPLVEQRAIAETLSDVDALLGALAQLIAKKQDLKRAAMQQLLTGQTRLPGFHEEWKVTTLFDLVERKKELFDDGDWIEAEFLTDSGIRLIQTGNIGVGSFVDRETKKYICSNSFKKLRCKEIKIGDILICRLGEPAGRACIDPPPLKWSDLRYVFDSQEGHDGKEALQG
jgi:restriction endonuclease S subunit